MTTAPVLKKRPKGRWFISVVLATLLGFVGFTIWQEFIHYQAYGELIGQVIELSSIAEGRITEVRVDEGDFVMANQLLAVVNVRELEDRQRQLENQLSMALANLQVRYAELDVRQQEMQTRDLDRKVNYDQLLGQLNARQSRLEELESAFQSNVKLYDANAISESEYLSAKLALEGELAEREGLARAIEKLDESFSEKQHDRSRDFVRNEQRQIGLLRKQIADNDRLRGAAEVRAPVAGRIIRCDCHAGEFIQPEKPVFELLQADSIEAVVYLPQNHAGQLKPKHVIRLLVKPLGEYRSFQVTRVAPEIVSPPASLRANYRSNRGLVRIHAAAVRYDVSGELAGQTVPAFQELSSWLNAEVALPRFGYRASGGQAAGKPTGKLQNDRSANSSRLQGAY